MITWGLKKLCFVHCVFTSFYLPFTSPKWQQATGLHQSKLQIERGMLVKESEVCLYKSKFL